MSDYQKNHSYKKRPASRQKQGHGQRPTFSDVSVKVGQKFPLTIKRLGINGEGIGYFKRKITFIPGALPGEVVTAKVTKVTDKYLEAKTVTVREPSPDRVTAEDPAADLVGGFELAHLAYPAQLAFKKDLIGQALEKFKPNHYEQIKVLDTLGMATPAHYRNKASLPIRKLKGQLTIGLYKRGTHDLVDLPEMATQDPRTLRIIRQLGQILDRHSLSFYNEKSKKGLVKTLIVRTNQAGFAQATIVTTEDKLPDADLIIQDVQKTLPEVQGLFQNRNDGSTSLIWGDETWKLWGNDYLQEDILGLTFNFSPRAFLQLNYEQMEKTYEVALAALDLQSSDHLVDAYAGVGTLGLSMAYKVAEVRGMEIIPEAVDDARKNAEENDIQNAHYEVGSADRVFKKWAKDGFHPTALVVDPPRPGLEDDLKQAILKARPKKFVYISCNPSTLARDLRDLDAAYQVDYIQPIDMFPQTPRWEGVVKLSLK
ncbi:23S rRNA (uracil(1939)-C(5))-methyltransferase RlmD [Fructobacillus sp. M158]|uniref:23S rRNA (uracil(1939)-C(5))-methyltransferase RlmD n=1 Tax=Fructobacillus parabroussonetiae TaxID=2713174 RepID=UPI00200ADB3C|nr:23S rRNA (uracil(1939)-C(5))-methyltransferase RlmD [Fructobacillus parabroussonetiae]MCK8617929.1 23S rRNA (uracil(1939)-C(5))-methyltransferase RlmD [Fructobacillus parabroussonetiae]